MNKNNVLNVLKQCFETFIPAKDARTTVTPLALTINLVFFCLGDSKTFSLESIRRSMMSYLNKSISVGSSPRPPGGAGIGRRPPGQPCGQADCGCR